ncbi:tetratricopeptide repeat protein [Streptomyces sp. NPDC001809]
MHLSRTRSAPRPDRPRPVEEWKAEQLGVHPAIHGADDPDKEGVFTLPKYLARDHDRRLRHHLDNASGSEQAILVIVRGASCTGKTRTAFEAVRACLLGWQLVFPKTAKGLLALLNTGPLPRRTVLWLNETQNYLAHPEDGEEIAAALRGILEEPGPLVVLGTLWPEYHRSLTTTPRPGRDGTDAHLNARALLDNAQLVDVPVCFTTETLKDPRLSRDPSLAAALATTTDGRITQTLAAGPQLVDHYQQPTEPHGPYGHAVITAAMDARRLGHTSPLPAALLEAAAPAYLTAEQRAAAPDTWFTHALAYSREKVRGITAALEPVANPEGMGALPGVYRLSDYLDHHARTARRRTTPPEFFWRAVRDHAASAADLSALGDSARLRSRFRIAASLYSRVADTGDTRALTQLAWLRIEAGDLDAAEAFALRAGDNGDAQALTQLALLREKAGETQAAEHLARRAANTGNTEALMKLARLRGKAGDSEAKERLCLWAAEAGDTKALTVLADLRTQAGDLNAAEAFALRAVEAGVPTARTDLAKVAERCLEAGDIQGAERLYLRAAEGEDYQALTGLAWLREQAGDFDEAATLTL